MGTPGYWPRKCELGRPHHGIELEEGDPPVRGDVDELVNDLFLEKEDELIEGIIETVED
jgi:hypothetical protein